jgi:acyl-homoserine-lactone acylase
MGRRSIAVVVLCAGAAVVALFPTGAASAAHGDRYAATIRRTQYGIPHVSAGDYGDLGYGYGYAFAQDNLCVLADEVVTLRGERPRYYGADATSTDALVRGTTDLASDTYFQGLRDSGTVARLMARPAPLGPTADVRKLVDGYVAGYNRYLKDTGVAHLPDPTCRGQAWVEPVTALDIWTSVYLLNGQTGDSAVKQLIATAVPPSAAATSVAAVPSVAASGIGSNGWALGSSATDDHDGMVLADPHLPWTGDARLYQVQLTIPGKLDVSGVSFYGTPVVQIGHTDGVAWTHTASHAQHASMYRLALAPGDPTSYLVDGKTLKMGRQNVNVTVRAGDGTLSTVTRTIYSSRYGPVLAAGWTADTAYALRDANADNLRSLNEWLAMDRSQNLNQLRAAQSEYQAMPWMYTLATDASGTAYFADTSVVPHLTDTQATTCVLQANPERPDIVDGTTSACDWGGDPDAIEPGLFGPRRAPTLTRNDFVANSNNSPLYANPGQPLTGYQSGYDTREQLELRPQLGLRMIGQRIDGSDGLDAPGFTLDTLAHTMLGNRNYSGEVGRSDVVAMCRDHPILTALDGTPVDVRAACNALATWDGRDHTGSAGAVFWSTFFDNLVERSDGSWWRTPYDPAEPVTTPHGIDGNNIQVQQTFAGTVQEFAAAGTPFGTSPGETMRWAGVPLEGCDENSGCFNVVDASPTSGTDAISPTPRNAAQGSSFVMAAEMTAHGPVARTLLTYSESANPDSPHYADQTALFSREQWVTERFTQADIAADPYLTTQVLGNRGRIQPDR